MINRCSIRLVLCALLGLAACAAPEGDGITVGKRVEELDDMGTPPAGMELFVLAPGADVVAAREAFERLDATIVHHLPPRLLVGKVPAGAEAVLQESGVVARFARAVSPGEVSGLDTREARFVRLFSSRYYPEATPRLERVVPKRLPRVEGEPFEAAPVVPAAVARAALAPSSGDDDQAEQNERFVNVPYASGRVVVSVILPESNGRGAPDTESWSEDTILETYAKVQAGLEAVARHEPNSKLSFVLHYESAPAPGGLEGTVDLDWEYGKVAAGAEYSNLAYAQLWSHIMGREIPEFEYWQAQAEYLTSLKQRYAADSAFIVYVAANQNYTAGFRAYAGIGGPSTSLDSTYGYEVFLHEFGHIFGALDEYCPDACISPSSLHGYLGIVNANATFRPGNWGGIRGGRGESQPSLMAANIANGVNGYTRGAWGWLDSDGDGLVEVRDTLPRSRLHAEVSGSEVTLTGRIVDVPATSNGATPFSVNRIAAVHLRAAGTDGSWVRIPVASTRRGREDVAIALGSVRAGHHELEVRGENSVGNVEPTPRVVTFDVAGSASNSRPLVSLSASAPLVSTSAPLTLTASTLDLDGDAVRVRFDVDGDGRHDTAFGTSPSVSVRPSRAGILQVGVEAEDAQGARASAVLSLYVLADNAPVRTGLSALPSPIVGSAAATLLAQASARDPESGSVALNFKLERDDFSRSLTSETGFAGSSEHEFAVSTPLGLPFTGIDLSVLDPTLDRYATVFDAERIGTHVALGLGEQGLVLVDLADPAAPRLAARLSLQAPAFDLHRAGNALFVYGEKLAVVDVTNPAAPVEVLQARTTRHQRSVELGEPWSFDETSTKPMPLWATFHEQIEHVRLELGLTHPAWHELRISLVAPSGDSVVLWDHQRRGRNQRSIVVDDRRLEGLRRLVGTRASGDFRVEIVDDVINGSRGEIGTATLSFDTAHRAYEPALDKVSGLVGSVRGRTLVLSGPGLESVDVSRLDQLRRLDVVETAYVQRAHLVGERVLALSVAEGGQEQRGRARPRLRGLFALDVAHNGRLRELRRDTEVVGESLAIAGSRLYVSRGERDGASTSVGSLSSFFAGRRYWLGDDSPLFLGAEVAGDDRTLWSVRGNFERFDVRNPAAITLLERFEDPMAWSARFFDASSALVLGAAGELALVDLGRRTSVVSEVYRVTVQSRDAAGLVSETSRSVHVVPYDRAPAIGSARFVSGATTRDPFQLAIDVTDPDGRPSWDGYLAVRIDWEGDGHFDGPWQGVWGDTVMFDHLYAEAGDYQVRVQARDGFHALSSVVTVPVRVAPYVAVPCTDSAACPDGEYCDIAAVGCGGTGVCERVQECYDQVAPVCSCDGETYRNACEAQAAGALVAYEGVCEGEVTRCGGPEGDTCTVAGQFCRYLPGETAEQSCGNDQAVGDCIYPPSSCFIITATDRIGIPRPGRRVCGCDGVTYASECAAAQAGISVEFYGTCESGPDCLQTGCAEGSYCAMCWGGYQCLPEDAHC